MTRRVLEARIVAKAWRDPSFKANLLRDPKAAVQAELEAIDPAIRLPAALQVQVHEETPTTYHLVLPRNPRDISLGEVVGDDLEALAPQTIAVIVVGAVTANAIAPATASVIAPATLVANVVTTLNVVTSTNAVR
jgi:hypothetical protein